MPNVYDPSQKSGINVGVGIPSNGGFSARLDDLIDVSTAGGPAYNILYRKVDGSFALKPMGYGTILGHYDTESELTAAHPSGAPGQAYIVGEDLYVWDTSEWVNVGPFRGEAGADGSGIVVKGTEPWSYIDNLTEAPEVGDLWILSEAEAGVGEQ